MSIFGNIQSASMSQSGPKLPNNFNGVVEVIAITFNPAGFHGPVYIVELVVHETNSLGDAPIGFRPSWTANMKHANTLGNIKQFLAAAWGLDPKTQVAQINQGITPQFVEATFSPAQPVRGKFVHVITNEIKTKNGNDFMAHDWSPTTKQFASRIADQAVSPTNAPSAPTGFQGGVPSAPGGFQAPTAPGGFPGFPGAAPSPAPTGLPSFPSFGASLAPGGFPTVPMGGAAPAFPPASVPQLPTMGAPQGFGPAPAPFGAAPGGFPALPGLPGMAPALPTAPPLAPAFPPPGWIQHPQSAQHWYNPQQPQLGAKTEADLRAGR